MNSEFRRKLVEGEIHFRDRFQFELKSEFFPDPKHGHTIYSQEFYIFLPLSFQVNPENYSKELFYQDQTELIRQKTPEMELRELVQDDSNKNPFIRIEKILLRPATDLRRRMVIRDLQLLGNIYRSSIRERVRVLIEMLESDAVAKAQKKIRGKIDLMIERVTFLQERYQTLNERAKEGGWAAQDLGEHFRYVNMFMAQAKDQYLTGLLAILRDQVKAKHLKYLSDADGHLTELLRKFSSYRFDSTKPVENLDEFQANDELFQYERGLLKKYVLDALLLDVERQQVAARYSGAIGAFAAALAMFVYLLLFVWKSDYLVMNTTPFILATTVLYVLKDRVKEGVKVLWQKSAGKYFPDYRTEIRFPEDSVRVGELREYFSFLREGQVPDNIAVARNNEYHRVLEAYRRPEVVIYSRKDLHFDQKIHLAGGNHALNTIFRFSVRHFLEKLSDPYVPYITIDHGTNDIAHLNLPKVYHLNIVVKSTARRKGGEASQEIKKFRIILDKKGLKRVERLL